MSKRTSNINTTLIVFCIILFTINIIMWVYTINTKNDYASCIGNLYSTEREVERLEYENNVLYNTLETGNIKKCIDYNRQCSIELRACQK